MSRAFIRETDEVPASVAPPELKVSPHPNYVTPRGLKLIDTRLTEVERALADVTDAMEKARLERDLRYWAARRASAQLVEPGSAEPGVVGFATRVTISRDNGDPETIEIVGEDEADPTDGRLAWTAPLARAMMGAEEGDVVEAGPRQPPIEVEILKVEQLRVEELHAS